MDQAIVQHSKVFMGKRILSELLAIVTEDFDRHKQLSVTSATGKIDDLYGSVGSLFDHSVNQFTRDTSDYSILNPLLIGSYTERVINGVVDLAAKQQVKIGRIRLMLLESKTCYTYHTDPEEFRYHIPLETNPNCFFMVDKQIYQMKQIGRLYTFRTNLPHTAINASNERRYHLVFDTY